AGAADLADDLGRFLDGRPVAARPLGPAARAARWARRRPGIAGLLAAVAAVAAVGFAGVLWQWRQTGAALGAAKAALYLNQIARARHELQANHVGRAERLLDETAPAARGWEWHYLKGQCQTDLFTLRGGGGAVQSVAFSADGGLIAAGGGDWY